MKQLKIIGFQAGQFGDLIMTQPLCRTVKKLYPHSEFTLGIGNKFKEAAEIFKNNTYIDKIHIWDSYDDFPKGDDINYLRREQFNIVFYPVPHIVDQQWFNKRYIIDEWRHSYGLPLDDNRIELNFPINKKEEFKDFIALSLFSWLDVSAKSLSEDQIKQINSILIEKGYKTLQIGLPTEKDINATARFVGSYIESANAILSCRLLVSIDTSWVWLASAFEFPVVGLFGYEIFLGAKTSKNWQAQNKNAIYLEANRASNIKIENINNTINQIL